MKIHSKFHWDTFIYGLLYPGFLGSMIYELVDHAKDVNSLSKYFTLTVIIEVIITFFYCLDYLHLYGDMHPIITQKYRNKWYYFCDVFSCLLFFFSFVFVKINKPDYSMVCISLIPLLFLIYKFKIKSDRLFHVGYVAWGLITNVILFRFNLLNNLQSLLAFSSSSFGVYIVYVFWFYEKVSKEKYSSAYPKIEIDE